MNTRQLSEELECPVCYQLPRQPPIYQCENGHLICSVCQPKLNETCPQGRCNIKGQRCLLAESILEKSELPRPCKFSLAGCMHEEEVDRLIGHEDVCSFRVVHCPDPECFDKPLQKDIVPHVIKDHYVLPEEMERQGQVDKCLWILEDYDFMKRSFDRTWPLSPFKYDDTSFFSVLMRSCHDQLWYAWIYVLGSPKIASGYKCEVKLQSLNESGESLTFRGKPHSLDKSGQQVILSSEALMMSDTLLKNMYKEMSQKEKNQGEENLLKFLICIEYKVEKI